MSEAPAIMTRDYQQTVAVIEAPGGDVVYQAHVSIEYRPAGREGDAVKTRGAVMRFEAEASSLGVFEALHDATSLALRGAREYHEGLWEHA